MQRMRMRAASRIPKPWRLIMKGNHLTMILAALSLSVSPLATLPATAQQNTQSSAQAQTGTPSGSNAQSGSSTTGTDCTPDASGA
jgi:hypothetical protein